MKTGLKWSIFWRSLFLQGCWNYEKMQNVGFAFAIFPALRSVYSGRELGASCRRHLELFNTQPFMASFALGVVTRMEEDRAAAPEPEREALAQRINSIKTAMASPLAAIGDRLFWGTLRPFTLVITLLACWAMGMHYWASNAYDAALSTRFHFTMPGMLLGLGLGMAVYNGVALWIRWSGLEHGYNCGAKGSCGLDFMNWQTTIKRLKIAGFTTAVLLFALKTWDFWRLAVVGPSSRQDLMTYCLIPATVASTWLLLRNGWHIVRIYIAAVAVSALALFFV